MPLRDHRREGAAERVPVITRFSRIPLGPRGSDVVLAKDVQHRPAGEPGVTHVARQARREGDPGQHQVLGPGKDISIRQR